ncbi:MAG TPA: ABC transporter permease [Geobacterales bacterium]|nr:ABC transporter permease [Geobacterales bacterium]
MRYPVLKFLTIAIILSLYFLLPVFSTLIVQDTYNALISYISPNPSDIIVYDINAKTPATSRLPLSLYTRLISIDGVEAVSPETIVFTLVENNLVIARGIDITQFTKFYDLKIVDGNNLTLNDTDSVLVGLNLAKKLGINIGKMLTIAGIGTSELLEVKVKGIFEVNNEYDEEILMPLFLANILGGLPNDYVSYFRVKVNSNLNPSILYERFQNATPTKVQDNTLLRYLIGANVNYGLIKASQSYSSMEEFLIKQLSISQYTIIGFLVVIIALTALLLRNIVEYYLNEMKLAKKIMKLLGAKRKKILNYLISGWLIIFIFALILSSFYIYIAIYVFNNFANLYLFGHLIIFSIPTYEFGVLSFVILFLSLVFLYYDERKL